jgi:hypothetical protein
MTIQGYIDYQRREYCKDVQCPIQILLDKEKAGSEGYEFVRKICSTSCIHTCHEFHAWLINHSFEVVRPQ